MNQNSFHEAIMNAEVEAKNSHIKEADETLDDIDVNSHDTIGQSPLHFASQNGCPFSANTFIRKGADVNELNNMGKSPLYLASEYGHYSIVSSLLNSRNIDITLPINYSALHIASKKGYSSIVKMLLRKGIDVNSPNRRGTTTAIKAAYDDGEFDIVSLLLSKGANIDFASPKDKAIIIEYEKQKWEKLFNENKIAEFEQLDYKDKSVKNEYNKIKVSGMNQMLKNKFIYMHDNDEFDWAQSLLDEFNEGGKKRRKTKRKHKKRRKTRKY
jgi:ankyrin repeat protein